MSEQNHEGDDDSELEEKVAFKRQIGVKGESTIPEKFPAIAIFVPITFSKVTLPTSATASAAFVLISRKIPIMIVAKLQPQVTALAAFVPISRNIKDHNETITTIEI